MPVSIFNVVDFPAPFGPKKTDDLPGWHLEREIVHGDLCSKPLCQLLKENHFRNHLCPNQGVLTMKKWGTG